MILPLYRQTMNQINIWCACRTEKLWVSEPLSQGTTARGLMYRLSQADLVVTFFVCDLIWFGCVGFDVCTAMHDAHIDHSVKKLIRMQYWSAARFVRSHNFCRNVEVSSLGYKHSLVNPKERLSA